MVCTAFPLDDLSLTRHSQLVINDPRISAKHLRVYSVVYDSNDVTEVDMLVYAEDLSRNGTYWNASLIGRGNGGFLLSPDDVLKLSSAVSLTFKSMTPASSTSASFFDPLQEQEMEVCIVQVTLACTDPRDRSSEANSSSRTDFWVPVPLAKFSWRSSKQRASSWPARLSTCEDYGLPCASGVKKTHDRHKRLTRETSFAK